jgi:hypothetical protein
MDPAAALTFGVDGATAAAAAWNAAWFGAYAREHVTGGRRSAAATLAVMNAGVAVQAIFAQALYSAHRLDLATGPFFETAPWLASRALLLAGTLLLSVLILRRRPQ